MLSLTPTICLTLLIAPVAVSSLRWSGDRPQKDGDARDSTALGQVIEGATRADRAALWTGGTPAPRLGIHAWAVECGGAQERLAVGRALGGADPGWGTATAKRRRLGYRGGA